MKLFREAGMPRRRPPAIPNCAEDNAADGPKINTPLRGVTYTLRRQNTEQETIPLEASTAADVETVFWFDGKALIAKSEAAHGAVAWRPSADGVHVVRVIDDHGRTAERDVSVQLADGR